jgi:hypothetical protein
MSEAESLRRNGAFSGVLKRLQTEHDMLCYFDRATLSYENDIYFY